MRKNLASIVISKLWFITTLKVIFLVIIQCDYLILTNISRIRVSIQYFGLSACQIMKFVSCCCSHPHVNTEAIINLFNWPMCEILATSNVTSQTRFTAHSPWLFDKLKLFSLLTLTIVHFLSDHLLKCCTDQISSATRCLTKNAARSPNVKPNR